MVKLFMRRRGALGCALRRSELAALESRHIQQRDGRWVFVDLVGKRKRIRTVPIPAWSKFPKQLRRQGIMEARYEREPLLAAAGVCDRPDQSGTPRQESEVDSGRSGAFGRG